MLLYRHSYSSLSHNIKDNDLTGDASERLDAEGETLKTVSLSEYDKSENQYRSNIYLINKKNKRYKPNENVITQGESGDCLYVVEEGNLVYVNIATTQTNDLFILSSTFPESNDRILKISVDSLALEDLIFTFSKERQK